jgi:carboxypeptidase T
MRISTYILGLFVFFTYQVVARATPYTDVKTFLNQIASEYPQNVVPFDLGLSDSGDVIKGLKIGNGPIHDVVVGTHHGNEYGSTEVAKAVAASLAQNPMAGYTIYVIPVLNISGYNSNDRREALNGTTYDPNRDYPGPCGTEGPFKLKSTAALAKMVDKENIIASATLHTFYPAVVYPWGIPTHDLATPYQDIFTNMVKAATVESHYQIGNSTEVIYPASGCYEDYAFWKLGIWSILFELGNTHTPSVNDVADLVRDNVPGIRRMLSVAPTTRAIDHDFHGKCDPNLTRLDLATE